MREGWTGQVSIMAGCFNCHGDKSVWEGKNALGVAARHHDATGHATWCERVLVTRYGERGGVTSSSASSVSHD